MPGWPIPAGRRCITIELATEHVEHLDTQSEYEGCSRAAYLRRLIVRDIERQGPSRVATDAEVQ
jgi:predicted DNA-binding protein